MSLTPTKINLFKLLVIIIIVIAGVSIVYVIRKRKEYQTYDNLQLHWFWRVTTKWYFFLVFYTSLTLLLSLIDGFLRKKFAVEGVLYALLGMPQGLGFIALWFGIINFVQEIPPIYIFFHPLLILSIIIISYYKAKKKIILKWLIITWLLLIILSFVGCISIAGSHF